MKLDWLQLRRLVGIDPTIPLSGQEGHLRYVRNGAVDGQLYLGRGRANSTLEWAGVQFLVTTSAGIQPAMTAAGAAGGGVVHIGPGTFDVSGLLIDSNVWIRGAGVDATILRATAGTDYPVLLTREFGDHTGTNDTDSEVNFKISDLTIDGNKASCPGTNGYGMRLHGANFAIERVRVFNCNETGIDSEWSSSADAPTTTGMHHSMEARLIDVEVHECDGDGITWNGPHDSFWWGVVTWENGARGIYINNKGSGTLLHGCHSWGNAQTTAIRVGGDGTHLIDCQAEGASVEQLLITGNDVQVIGGSYFAAGAATPVGIFLNGAAGYMIQTKIMNCTSGALKYSSDNGLGWIEALVYQASGAAESGTPHASNRRMIRVFGGGTGAVDCAGGGTPTVSALTAAGTTATASINGNDTSGAVTVTPGGAGIAVGDILDLTFGVSKKSSVYNVLLTPASLAARALGGVVGRSARTTAKTTIRTETALTAGSDYVWDYRIESS